ncbi:hypothetical protein LCGC14_2678000, partial [marine sediment metagenome]
VGRTLPDLTKEIPAYKFKNITERDLWFREFGNQSLINSLKQEAIKNIIVLQMLKLEYGLIRFVKQIQINAKIKWIKYFFNISEEDLK